MFFAFVAAFANSFGVISNKLILGEKGISWKKYLTLSFFFTSFFTLLLFPFYGKIAPEFFSGEYLLVFFGIVLMAFIYNIAFCYSLSKSMVCDIEPLVLLAQPVAVLMAVLFFPSERSVIPLVLTLVAITALIFSRVNKKHLKMSKITLLMITYIAAVALEAQLVKIVLPVISPVALYTVRCFVLSIMIYLTLKPNLRGLKRIQFFQIAVNNFATTIENIARFYAVLYIGIVNSSLLLLLAPVMVLVYSKVFLREKLTLKKVIADVIIVICVALVYFIK